MKIEICQDCLECKKVKGSFVCHELFDRPLAEVEECPFGIEIEEVNKMNEAEKVKIQHGAKEEKSSKPRAKREPDAEKIQIINDLYSFLDGKANISNVNITNQTKIIEFDHNNNHYKLDLIKTRKKK